ncbi:MAG: 2-hydroxyacyl-CoA dehydratase [Deltaproteobacteria bacterium]|nr:2-hydroxyacyl-CoA dehydratase [Deltaproteobacteria bacterium]
MKAINSLQVPQQQWLLDLTKARNSGTKIIGYTPGGYMPEELIYACGAIPVALIRGGDPEPVAASAQYVPRFLDTFARAQIGYRMLEDEPLYKMIDLLVCPVTDNNIRAIADCFDFYTDIEVFRFGVPHNKEDDAFEYYLEGLRLLKAKLEDFTGTKINKERLEDSVKLMNRMRKLLREFSLMRKSDAAPISGGDFIRLCHASFHIEPATFVSILESRVQELKRQKAENRNGVRPRVLLTGSTLAMGDYKIPDLLEAAGADIVVEEFAEGLRNYWEEVRLDGDPLKALADSYFRRRVPPAYFRPWDETIDFLLRLAKDFRVDAVVWYQLLYRDAYNIQAVYFKQILKDKLGLQMLELESDYDPSEAGRLRMQIETLIQTVRK